MKPILVAEDEPGIQELYKIILKRFGYSSEIHNNGLSVVQKIQDAPNNYSLLITDNDMPVMNGVDVIQTLEDNNYNIPILFVTSSTIEDIPTPQYSGKLIRLRKPASIHVVRSSIEQLVS